MKFTVLYILVLVAFCCIHLIDGGRGRGGSRGGGSRSGGSRSGGGYGGSRGGGGYGGSRPKTPIYHPPVHVPSPSVYKPPIQSSPPVHKPSPGISPPIFHPSVHVPPPHGNVPKPNAPLPGVTNSKDSSSIFINNEGGGRTRPGTSYPDWANPGMKPPSIGSPTGGHSNTNPYPSHPNSKPYPGAPPPIGTPGGFGYPSNSNTNPHRPYPPVIPHGGYHPMPQPGMIHNNPYPMQPGVPHYGPPPGVPQYGPPHIYGGPVMSQPYVPGQTIILPSQSSSSPGIGQLVKEALVFSTVNAGVNRLINGAPHHHHYGSSSPQVQPAGSSTVTNNTTIIYNNYGPDQGQGVPGVPPSVPGAYVPGNPGSYTPGSPGGSYNPSNSGSYPPAGLPQSGAPGIPPPVASGSLPNPVGGGLPSVPAPPPASSAPVGAHRTNQSVTVAPEAPPAPQYYISDDELMRLTETLFSKEEMNLKKYVTLYLQNKVKPGNVTDEAPAQLMYTTPELENMPTVRVLKNMFDNYQINSTLKESSTSEIKRQENLLLDTFLNTDVMLTAMKWLASKYYIEPDDFEMKDTLRHMWLTKIDGATSGFERIFLAELYPGPSFIGAQNWIYFASKEPSREINYMGYTEERALAEKAMLLKINVKMGDAVKQNVTMLVGTSPELEMSLYTVCFYARPNDICPVSLGGTKFYLYTHSFRYFGKDLIDVGIVAF
ncbi:endoribonuclease CG2145-like isoform X2 [Diachasmimorpha longicaudata]|uniref:endoribonuclease CG2145-like isoform X2 n=1 Tax=Diachasmimorpha longicaudata TaxID=58733 RepID=UPI0030B8C540